MPKILLVEDEVNVRAALCDYLTQQQLEVVEASSFKEAQLRISQNPDLILLDWMLKDGQGIELLREWRKKGINTPCIMLTARTDLVDKIVGLELGANDYLTKPFEPRELLARIHVQLRQIELLKNPGKPAAESQLAVGDFRMNRETHEIYFQNELLPLSKTEFNLLQTFLENPHRVFARDELLNRVWGFERNPTTRTVDTHLLQLRQKTKSSLFETVHGIGYRFRP